MIVPVVLIGLLLADPARGAGQAGAPAVTLPSEPDSSLVMDRVRVAQSRFEQFRRRNLPSTWGSWGSYCDERVGRMCMRYDEGDWQMEPEPETIAAARGRLLDELSLAAVLLPDDPFVLGQRIRYLAEADRWWDAEALARSCTVAQPGWCDAVLGLALHGMRRYEEALEAFSRALEQMGPADAGRWRDPSVLLQDQGDALRNGDGPLQADALVHRTWQLADPLFLVPGNDRLTEHLARFAMARLRGRGRTTYGMAWGPDLEELLVRYGWEVGWERTRPGPGESRRTGIVGHHHPDALSYMPLPDLLSVPSDPDAEGFDLDSDRPRSSYAPLYAPEMSVADVQIARFWRGDSIIVVAGYRMEPPPEDRYLEPRPGAWTAPLPPEVPVEAGLFLIPDRGGGTLSSVRRSRPRGALALSAPAGSYVVSVEAWSPELQVASRRRVGLRADSVPADVPVLSDALLLDPTESVPSTLDQAVGRAWPGRTIQAGQRLGLAWEVSGIGEDALPVDYVITLERRDRGFINRAGSLFGLLGGGPELTLAWSEEIWGSHRAHFRAADLGLPDLEEGRYAITLEVTLPGRSTMVRGTEIRVVAPPSR